MIQNGKVVHLTYTLKNAQGEILDQADQKDPFVYLHGASQIVIGLENALTNLKIGDTKKVTVQPVEGYGEINPDLKITIPRTEFPKGINLEVGMQFRVSSKDGGAMVIRVESIEGDNVKIDGNHPLAGQTLHFDVQVLQVRDATQEELDHGHAHNGGHHEH